MLNVSNLTYRVGGRTLFEGASAHIPPGHRVGLVGPNGSGKTTLLRLIAGQLEADGGDVRVRSGARIGMLAQEAPDGAATPLEMTLAADEERVSLLAAAQTATDPAQIAEIQERLVSIDAHAAPGRAASILAGLGFDEEAQRRPLSSFSGGWKMRVALAAVLFSAPDLLMLDEPTNHLDLEATIWLESFLRSYPHTLLMVSHDRSLLDNAADRILHLWDNALDLYQGGYSAFARVREARIVQNEALRNSQLAEKKRLERFVERFRAKATKARQAQSRVKLLEKMQPITPVTSRERPSFDFTEPSPCSSPLLRFEGVDVGYSERTILHDLNLSLFAEDRVALLGANGNGKTTLARLIADRIRPIGGRLHRASKLRIGYFAQDQLEQLTPSLSALDHMKAEMSEAPPPRVRAWLGRFGLGADKAETPTRSLSGGEKTRLALAMIARGGPNLLILDEPTNHLDMDAREALVQALTSYAGGILLVSHDRHLVETTADQLWLVEGGTVTQYFDDLDAYRAQTLSARRDETKTTRPASSTGRTGRRESRRNRAEERARLAPLKSEVAAAERALEELTDEKERIDRELADPDIYADGADDIGPLSRRQKELEVLVARAEDRWLEAQTALEEATE